MDWQHVIERIAVNAGYIVTFFTAIKYFVLNPLEKRRKKENDEKIAEQNAFQASYRKHQKIKSHLRKPSIV